MEELTYLRWILLITVVIYFIFDYFDEQLLKDEREEFIRLKTFELVHKVTTFALCAIAIAYTFFPWLNALYPILILILAYFYTELAGKIYYRRKF